MPAVSLKAFSLLPESCPHVQSGVFSEYYAGVSKRWSSVAMKDITDPHFFYTAPNTRKSASGDGSQLGPMTSTSLEFLCNAIATTRVQTLVDVPCGDMNWQLGCWETTSLRAYVGLDIVEELVAVSSQRFAHHSNKRFAAWDIALCPMPKIVVSGGGDGSGPPEMVHMRDMLQHLVLDRAVTALANVILSGTRYLVTTSYFSRSNQSNPNLAARRTKDGGWRPYDLFLPPFELPAPVRCAPAHGTAKLRSQYDFDHICLYAIDQHLRSRVTPDKKIASASSRQAEKPAFAKDYARGSKPEAAKGKGKGSAAFRASMRHSDR